MPDSDQRQSIAETSLAIWAIAAAMFAAVCLGYRIANLAFDPLSGLTASGAIAGCVAISVYYHRWRPDPWISIGADCTAQIGAILTLGVLLSYPLATFALPYRDAEFHAIDGALGLDWRAYLGFFNSHPLFSMACKLAYFSMRAQFPLVIAVLVMTSNFRRLQQYIVATTLALAITLVIFVFLPALGSYVFLNIPPSDYANVMPSVTFEQAQHLTAMRTAANFVIAADKMEGLISFPSFHTICGLLFTWAIWPVKSLRWPVAGLNAMLIVAVPIEGAHYFVDAIAGAVVAAAAGYGAAWLMPRLRMRALAVPFRFAAKVRAVPGASPPAR